MSLTLVIIVCFCGFSTLMTILQYESMEVSESYRKIYWDEQEEINMLDANLNVHL